MIQQNIKYYLNLSGMTKHLLLAIRIIKNKNMHVITFISIRLLK